MENCFEKIENFDNNFKKYIKKADEITFYNPDNLICKENKEDLICPICFFVLKNPISCSDKKNSHSFCKDCIDEYLKENNYCPTCKLNFEYKTNNELINKLDKFSFNCLFNNEGCNDIISYSDYLYHINNCKYNNIKYGCNIKKYDYHLKEFKNCGFRGRKQDMENHFKLCGYTKYKCIFCNEDILQMHLEEHVKNKCIFGIINYPNGDKYIGEIHNNLKDGYGKLYCSNGDKYEGEFKNDLKVGYGIYYFSNGTKIEGEFKNNNINGYGINTDNFRNKFEGEFINGMKDGYGKFYFSDGHKYLGEFKNNFIDGYGILYYSNGSKYIGEYKKNVKDGFGIYYFPDEEKYVGQWKNNLFDGYGIYYYADGDKFEGEYKNDLREGYGIYFNSNGNIYEGEYHNDIREGIGIEYKYNGDKYEGQVKNGLSEGYGMYYFSNGDKFEGEWKKGFYNEYGIFYSILGFKYESYFKPNLPTKILYIIYKILLLSFHLYSIIVRNKITLFLIIILIL